MSNELQKTNQGGELVKIDKRAFIEKYNPANMVTAFAHIRNVKEAVQADQNGIAYYGKHLGADTVLALIELHLVALNQSINVNQPLTKIQIKEIAIEIRAVYYFLSMVEIQFVFRKAKRGDYGQFYGALNMPSILDWFRQYTEDRIKVYQEQSEHQAKIRKAGAEVRDGKLFKNLNDQLDGAVVKVLKNVAQEIPKGFDEESFKDWKKDYNENGLQLPEENNENSEQWGKTTQY